jgi:hypothetical protein
VPPLARQGRQALAGRELLGRLGRGAPGPARRPAGRRDLVRAAHRREPDATRPGTARARDPRGPKGPLGAGDGPGARQGVRVSLRRRARRARPRSAPGRDGEGRRASGGLAGRPVPVRVEPRP